MKNLKVFIAAVDDNWYTISAVWYGPDKQEVGFHMKHRYENVSYEEAFRQLLEATSEMQEEVAPEYIPDKPIQTYPVNQV